MKVLVTGGAGYVGTELVSELAGRDDVEEIVVYDNLSRHNYSLFISEKLPPKAVRFVHGDLLDTRKLRRELDGVDVVFHLAARVSTPFAEADVHGFDQVNHWGTAELSYALEERPVSKLLYLSSVSVYGAREEAFDEDSEPRPVTAYAISKHRGERMLSRLSDSLNLHVVRCGNVYGYSKSMRFDAVINRFLFEAQFIGRVTVHGSGNQHRAFVHVRNAARALTTIALGEVPSGTYNLVERNLSVLDIISALEELLPELEILFIEQDLKLRNLKVERDKRLDEHELLPRQSFVDQLREIATHFAFDPNQPASPPV